MDQTKKTKKSKNYCFVIMSFGDNPALQDHYELGIKPTVEELGFDCLRADEIEHNERITDTIIERIQNSQFIIADLTDEKPNCYYELGYAHALRKNVIHTINKEASIHFDVKDFNFIIYSRLQELQEKLKRRIQATMQASPKIKGPDTLSEIAEKIEPFQKFLTEHKKQMLEERVTEYRVLHWQDTNRLPSPFNIPLLFHVKEGLTSHGRGIVLQKSDGALYLAENVHRGWGRYTTENKFQGLIQRAEDIEKLRERIQKCFDERDKKQR